MALNFPENPSNGQTHTENGITWVYDTTSTTWNLYVGAKDGKTRVAKLYQEEPKWIGGGTYSTSELGTWKNRTLNKETDPYNVVELNSGHVYFSVPAGSYEIKWDTPAYMVGNFQSRLQYDDNSSFSSPTSILGSSEHAPTNAGVLNAQLSSTGIAIFTVTKLTYVRIQIVGSGTPNDNNALGKPSTINDSTEIYTQVSVEDLATAVKDNATYVEGTSRVAKVEEIGEYGNTGAGTFTANQWNTRSLTNITDPKNIGISLNSNIVTVPAGTYSIKWSAPAFMVDRHVARLIYSNDSSFSSITDVYGEVAYTEYETQYDVRNSFVQTRSTGFLPSVTFTGTTYIKVQHFSNKGNTDSGDAMGVSSPWSAASTPPSDTVGSSPPIWTTIEIEDLATAVKEPSTGNTKVAVVKDQKNGGVQGGDFNHGWWRDRDLTVEDDPFDFVTLYPSVRSNGADPKATISNGDTPGYFSLPAGKYKISFNAVAHDVDKNLTAMGWSPTQSNINKTYQSGDFDGGYFYGTSMQCAGASTLSKGSDVVEISETSFFKVIHYSTATNSGSGFGQSVMGSADKETYLIIEIEDLATAIKEGGSGGSTTLAGLTDVNIASTPADNQALSYDTASAKWIPQTISGGGSGDTLPTRSPKSGSTSTLASGASTDLDISGHKAYHLLKIQVSYPSWVVIYTSDAARQADDSRAEGTDPLPGSGVIAEVSTTTANGATFIMSPGVFGWSDESTPSTTIPLKVKNKDSQARSINVELTVIQAEGPVV